MSGDSALEILKALAAVSAGTVTIVAAILAYRSPQLVKELFAGVNGLLLTIQKMRREKGARKSPVSDRQDTASPSSTLP